MIDVEACRLYWFQNCSELRHESWELFEEKLDTEVERILKEKWDSFLLPRSFSPDSETFTLEWLKEQLRCLGPPPQLFSLLSKAADRIAAAAAAGGGVGCGEGGDWARLRRDLVLKESGRKEEDEEEVEKDRVAGRPELVERESGEEEVLDEAELLSPPSDLEKGW